MKLTRLLIWVIIAFFALKLYGYLKIHSSGDVLAYKHFAAVVLEDNAFMIERVAADKAFAVQVLEKQAQRMDRFGENSILFTYYVIKNQSLTNGGKSSLISAEQVSRVDPPGATSFLGESAIRIRHRVELVKEEGNWRVVKFNDLTTP